MDEAICREVCQWLIKSQRDLGAARLLLQSKEPYLDLVAYHCQQSAEKAIKAYLTYRELAFQKTHNLVALLTLAITFEAKLNQWQELAEVLTPWATEFRYPGDVLEPERAEVEHALVMTAAFTSFVMQLMPDEISLE